MTYLHSGDLPEKYKSILNKYGRCVALPESEKIPLPVGRHPDTLIGVVAGRVYVCKNEIAVMKTLDDAGINYSVSEKECGEKYPDDCAANFFTTGNIFIGRTASAMPEAVNDVKRLGYEIIDVKQGYAHCACAVVGGGVITADDGIFRALKLRGVPSLKISPGGVSLPPFDYGFIGGASGNINKTTVMFFGSLDHHPDGEKIRAFCAAQNVKIIEGDGNLCDFGGIIALDT